MEFGVGFDDVRPKPSSLFRVAVLGGGTPTDDAIETLQAMIDAEALFNSNSSGGGDAYRVD